jgi:hypothetical protein
MFADLFLSPFNILEERLTFAMVIQAIFYSLRENRSHPSSFFHSLIMRKQLPGCGQANLGASAANLWIKYFSNVDYHVSSSFLRPYFSPLSFQRV